MWSVRRCESDSGSHVCRGGLPPLEQRDALYTTRRSRAKLPEVLTAAEEEQDRRGPGRAERKQAREQSERAQRGRIEPPRRGGATPEARANAACATERNATRTHSRARGASRGPADGGRPREGGAEATAPAERSERKPARTAGAATRGGSDGRARATGEARAQCASTPKKPRAQARMGRARGNRAGRWPRGRSSHRAKPAAGCPECRRDPDREGAEAVVDPRGSGGTTTLHSPRVFIDH